MLHERVNLDAFDNLEYQIYCQRVEKEKEYAEYCANLLRTRYSQADAIYENAIIALVGEVGLMLMRTHGLIEGCGEVFGRKLYTL